MAKPAREVYSADRAVEAVMPRLKQPRAAGEAVTATALGKHLDLTIQRIKQLANEGVIEQLSTGRYDHDACRIAYLRWLRAPERRMQRSKVDSDFVKAKTELIAIRVREKKRELMETSEAMETMEQLIGTVLVAMGGMAARIAGSDMNERRRIDQVVYETRVKMANQFNEFANKAEQEERQKQPTTDTEED